MHACFFRVIFAKYEFCAYLACIYFRECRLKKISLVFNFMKSTKVREIRENMYTRKFVRLSYPLSHVCFSSTPNRYHLSENTFWMNPYLYNKWNRCLKLNSDLDFFVFVILAENGFFVQRTKWLWGFALIFPQTI